MTKNTKNGKKIVKCLLRILIIVVALAIILSGLFWNRYINKNNLLEKYQSPGGQEVYLLGTIHWYHFNKWLNYSMEDILSAIENIQPDAVFIEARDDSFENYGVMDGPVDMAVVYSYCIDNDIPVEMIDWWLMDNNYQSNSTNEKRDDKISENIINNCELQNADAKVLVVCGAGHFRPQKIRLLDYGFTKLKIKRKSTYFEIEGSTFNYPDSTETVWEQRAYFYAYTYPEIVNQIEDLDDDIKSQFTEGNHDAFYEYQIGYCELFRENKLYE